MVQLSHSCAGFPKVLAPPAPASQHPLDPEVSPWSRAAHRSSGRRNLNCCVRDRHRPAWDRRHAPHTVRTPGPTGPSFPPPRLFEVGPQSSTLGGMVSATLSFVQFPLSLGISSLLRVVSPRLSPLLMVARGERALAFVACLQSTTLKSVLYMLFFKLFIVV